MKKRLSRKSSSKHKSKTTTKQKKAKPHQKKRIRRYISFSTLVEKLRRSRSKQNVLDVKKVVIPKEVRVKTRRTFLSWTQFRKKLGGKLRRKSNRDNISKKPKFSKKIKKK